MEGSYCYTSLYQQIYAQLVTNRLMEGFRLVQVWVGGSEGGRDEPHEEIKEEDMAGSQQQEKLLIIQNVPSK